MAAPPAPGPIAQRAMEALIGRAAGLADAPDAATRLQWLWTGDASFASHVARRIAYGHVPSVSVLAERTFETLAAAEVAAVAPGAYPVLAVTVGDWVVVLTADGQIKTAYRIDPGRASFGDNQRRLGYDIHDVQLPAGVRAELARLFGAS